MFNFLRYYDGAVPNKPEKRKLTPSELADENKKCYDV